MLKLFVVLAALIFSSVPVFAATVVLNNTVPDPVTGITATNYYCIAVPSTTCPALPWTSPTKTTLTGATTTGTIIVPAVTGQTVCCYGTFQAGAVESVSSNIVNGVVPPKGMVIVGPLVIM